MEYILDGPLKRLSSLDSKYGKLERLYFGQNTNRPT